MIIVSENVSLVTPEKNEAAPINANAPGSIHNQSSLFGACAKTSIRPIARPYSPPMYLYVDTQLPSAT